MNSRFQALSLVAAIATVLGSLAALYGIAMVLGLLGPEGFSGVDPFVLQMRALSAAGVVMLGVIAIVGAASLRVLIGIAQTLHANSQRKQP